jgi:hypothetical protein
MGWVGSPAWTESGVALLGVFMRGHVHVHSDISGIVSIASIKGTSIMHLLFCSACICHCVIVEMKAMKREL